MDNKDYNFQYTPLTGRLPGKSFVKQTEQAINELAGIVNKGAVQVGVITNLANQANDNSEEALEKATEALETAGRVYITLPNLDNADDYFDSQLYYFSNSHSANLPVEDTGFLEVKTNDTKTAAEQVFIADTTGLMYMRHGDITSTEVGDETVYSVTWETWTRALASEDYVQQEVNTGVDTANSYTDEQIRQHGNLPVGYEYFTFNPSIPQGSLPLFGGEYSRETYADLWAWVQTQTGYLITEAQWQSLYTANNGNVPFYSDGDASTTFRVPSLKCWVKSANGTVSEVGSYLEAGLPNITGSFEYKQSQGAETLANGSGFVTSVTEQVGDANIALLQQTTQATYKRKKAAFDASHSNPIYGNSTTVQPPSIVGMWLVKAYGVIVDTGTIDEQAYIDDRFNASKQYTDDEIAKITKVTTSQFTVLKGTTDFNCLERHGDWVQACINLVGITGTVENTWNEILQVPSGFISKYVFDFMAVDNDTDTAIHTQVTNLGVVRVWGKVARFRMHVVYLASD